MKDPRVDIVDPVAAVAEVGHAEQVVRGAVRAELGNLNADVSDLAQAHDELDERVETIERRFYFESLAIAASCFAYFGTLAFLRWKEKRDARADSDS